MFFGTVYLAVIRMSDKASTHQLPSFAQYVNKVFDLRRMADRLTDARQHPDISPPAVFRALFHGFVFRLPSLLALQADLAEPHLQQWIGAPRGFGDDVLRYSLCGFDLEGLEKMLVSINRRLKRNKAFNEGRVQGRIVAALDGVEVLSSYSRCCASCLERRVTSKDDEGNPVERLQYYHRAVGCQIISSPVKPFLALEWLHPGEGEDTAALRLLARLPELYGSRFFDILLLDSLYAQAPVLKLAQQIHWDLVITLKQEARELYQNAMGLFQARLPDETFTEREPGKTTAVRLWHAEGLPFTQDHPQPMQVIWSQEQVTENHFRKGKLVPETTDHQWLWITTLEFPVFPPRLVHRLGHDRWKNENNGWNDLTQNWSFKHGFLHACEHRPRWHPPDGGPPQPVPNRGLAAVTLILCLAFVLFSAFTLLHSKIFRRCRLTRIEVSRQLYRSLWQLQPPIRAPD